MRLEKSVLLGGKPTHCNWCTGILKGLRNIYKGRDCERYYCSMDCLKDGEDRALRYRATLAGRVCSPWYLVLAAILFLVTLGFLGTPKARAQEHQHHHPNHTDFYQHWKMPGTEKSCCNARFDQYGTERGDCEVAQYELRSTDKGPQWFAYVPMLQRVIPIPDDKIIRERNPDPTGRDGHTCVNRYTQELLCAVPPTGSL